MGKGETNCAVGEIEGIRVAKVVISTPISESQCGTLAFKGVCRTEGTACSKAQKLSNQRALSRHIQHATSIKEVVKVRRGSVRKLIENELLRVLKYKKEIFFGKKKPP